MERRKEDAEMREAALKEQKKIEEEVVSTGTLPRGKLVARMRGGLCLGDT